MSDKAAEAGSQTLARGLTVLALIGESDIPPSVSELAEHLGVHRSMVYRLVRTLEQHRFVSRMPGGRLAIGARLGAISRNASRDLQAAATPALLSAADDLDMTAFLVAYDGEAAVTLLSAEPRRAGAPVGQRPGTRHPIDRGAPGRVIRSMIDPVGHAPRRFEVSRDEVFEGLSAVAVPLSVAGRGPMSIAALYLSGRTVVVDDIAARLESVAAEIEGALT